MAVAFELYDASGARENRPRVCVVALDASQFEGLNQTVALNGTPYSVIGIEREVEIDLLDEPIDIVKVRRKPN